jgi:hypothetical protein
VLQAETWIAVGATPTRRAFALWKRSLTASNTQRDAIMKNDSEYALTVIVILLSAILGTLFYWVHFS